MIWVEFQYYKEQIKQVKSPYLKSVKSDNIPHSEDDWVLLQFFREDVAAHFNIRLISDL